MYFILCHIELDKFVGGLTTLLSYVLNIKSTSYVNIDIGRCGVSANETTLHPNNNLKKVNHYRSMYGLQHGALVHTEQQAIKGPKITSVTP